jgi:hypothetical protein
MVVGHEGRPNKVAGNAFFILLSLIVLLFFVCHTDTLNFKLTQIPTITQNVKQPAILTNQKEMKEETQLE